MSKKQYQHLANFSDWVAAAQRSHALYPPARAGRATQQRLLETLAFEPRPAKPSAVRVDARWTLDGVDGEVVSWSPGYGPRTEAFVLRPAGVKGRLPGIVALHDHGGYKYFGKEKIADGPRGALRAVMPLRQQCYEGRAYANELARRGYCVLVPDVFIWGSRKFPMKAMAQATWAELPAIDDADPDPTVEHADAYNDVARRHEDCLERYAAILGTSIAGVMTYEDRVAAAYLVSRRDVRTGGIGCVGLSGGGMRSCWLNATCKDIRAAVIVGLMTTWEGLLDHNVRLHAWGFFPHGWAQHGDWPDIAACRAPSPLLVQFDNEDSLFSPEGMRAGHRRLQRRYREAGAPRAYTGKFYPGPHKFDLAMQEDAFAWLARQMQA
jgi:dienelactone hydrolase